MKTPTQKGAVSGAALISIVLIVLAIIGIGIWWGHSATVATNSTTTTAGVPNTGADTTSQGYTYTIGTSTSTSPEPQTVTRTYTTYVKKTVPVYSNSASAYSGLSGSTYHNGTYGLTVRLPSVGYRTYMTAGGPNGLTGTAQIHFVAPGETSDAFVVNIWSKEQWNYVRNQENYVHLNTTNIGEGTYLGENFTWIYSDIIYSHQTEAGSALGGAVFY